jgi:transposase
MNDGGKKIGMHAMAHIEAAQREGKTLSAYAREHGLSKQHLYKVRRDMRARSAGSGKPRITAEKSSEPPGVDLAFVEVKVAATPASPLAPRARLWAHLPNGVNVELLCTSGDVDLLMAMMDSLGRTSCSTSTKV